MKRFDDTLECIGRIQSSRTGAEVCAVLHSITGQYGYEHALGASVEAPRARSQQPDARILFMDFPAPWMERYHNKGYLEIDHVLSHARRTLCPVRWSAAPHTVERAREERRVLDEASDFGLADGFTIPLVTLDGTLSTLSYSGRHIEMPLEAEGMIGLLSIYAMGRAIELDRAVNKTGKHRLTPREIECLRWCAIGKTEWEISVILGISEHTTARHLVNARIKLGTTNRVHTIAQALRLGIIT